MFSFIYLFIYLFFAEGVKKSNDDLKVTSRNYAATGLSFQLQIKKTCWQNACARARNSEDTRRSPRVSSETSAIACILPALLFYIVPKWNTTHSLGHGWTWATFCSHEDIWASSFTVFLSAVGNNFFNRKLNSVTRKWRMSTSHFLLNRYTNPISDFSGLGSLKNTNESQVNWIPSAIFRVKL